MKGVLFPAVAGSMALVSPLTPAPQSSRHHLDVSIVESHASMFLPVIDKLLIEVIMDSPRPAVDDEDRADEDVRRHVSTLWAEDWDSPEDQLYDL